MPSSTASPAQDLFDWHRTYWGANNAILVVAGDFDRAEMLQKLEETFGQWADAEKAEPPIPEVTQAAAAGVYMIEPEVIPNQGVIRSATSVSCRTTRTTPPWTS